MKCRRMSRTGGKKLIGSAYVALLHLHEGKKFDLSLARHAHRTMTYKKEVRRPWHCKSRRRNSAAHAQNILDRRKKVK